MANSIPIKSPRNSVFGGAGWVIALAIAFTLAAGLEMAVRTHLFSGWGPRVPWNGFTIINLDVPPMVLVAPIPKDVTPFRLNPPAVSLAKAERWTAQEGHKFLVSGDRVIGVFISGQARCYPLELMYWNEVVNDTVGSTPIAVTYNPLCDSVVVFDRRFGGRTFAFGLSGILYNSNLVMYDRVVDAQGKEIQSAESLWSQLGFRAIAGPLEKSRATLTVLPCQLSTFGRWRNAHPDTEVMDRDPARKAYEDNGTYGTYFSSDALQYPVSPEWYDPNIPKKTPTVIVGVNNIWQPILISKLARQAGPSGKVSVTVAGKAIILTYLADAAGQATVLATDESGRVNIPTVYSFAFAWYAIQGPLTR